MSYRPLSLCVLISYIPRFLCTSMMNNNENDTFFDIINYTKYSLILFDL